MLVTNGSLEAGHDAVRPAGRAGRTVDRRGALLRPHAARAASERGAELLAVPLEADGIDVGALEASSPPASQPELRRTSSPTSTTRPAARSRSAKRERLLELAAEHDFMIFEDDPYARAALRGRRTCRRCCRSTPPSSVVYASSFSKTIAPGVRVGYLIGPAGPDRGAHHARGQHLHLAEHAAQAIVGEFCRSGAIDESIETVKRALRERRDALRRRRSRAHIGDEARVRACPRAATSCGSSCPRTSTPTQLLAAAARARRDVRGGRRLHARGRHNALRLAYSAVTPEQATRARGGWRGAREPQTPARCGADSSWRR